MSNIPITDAASTTRKVDTFQRTEGPDTVETQAVAVVDPSTGAVIDFATQATMAALLTAANAIQAAAEALNTKATVINTGAVAGTVAVSNMVAAGLTDGQLRASSVPTADATAQATLAAIQALNDTMLYFITAMLDKMPRLDKTDRVTVDLTDYGLGGSAYAPSYVNAVSNPVIGTTFYRQFEPWNFSDAGSARIYQQITVGP